MAKRWLSPTGRMKIRKYLPLVILYPLSTAVGAESVGFVAKNINFTQKALQQGTSGSASSTPPPATLSQAVGGASSSQQEMLAQQEELAQLKKQILSLSQQIQALQSGGATYQSPTGSPNAVGAQTPTPPLGTHSTPSSATPAPAPPPTHAVTGASALRG